MTEKIASLSFDDLHRELILSGGSKAQDAYADWRKRRTWRGYEKVIRFVEGFSHQFLYSITAETLDDVKKRSEHALGILDKQEVLKVGFEDVHIPIRKPIPLSYVYGEGKITSYLAGMVELAEE